MNKKYPSLEKGFTLIEILVAIAIVGILSGVVLVSMSSYRAKSRSARLVGSLSSAISSMQSCWTFASGDVRSPSSGGNICYLGASQQSNASQYGTWPNLSQIGSDYSYGNYWDIPPGNSCSGGNCKIALLPNDESGKKYSYEDGFFVKKAQAAGGSACFAKSSWYFAAKSASDKVKVCCNSTMNGCKIIDYTSVCDPSVN